MLQKIKTLSLYIARNVTDVRFLGQMVFVVIVLLISWSCVKAIQTNYDLQKQIATLEQENEVKKLENQNLELSNKYLETNEFLELAARRQFGKAAPGEKVINVPKRVALAHTIELPKTAEPNKAEAEAHKSTYERNFEAWLNFFFHQENS
jgi:cell division protein FtsL